MQAPMVFGDGPVFLLGRNGRGKTTLLELMRQLIVVDLGSLRDEAEPVDLVWELEATGGYRLTLHLVVTPARPENGTRSPTPPPQWRFFGEVSGPRDSDQPMDQASFRLRSGALPELDPSMDVRPGDPSLPTPFESEFLARLWVAWAFSDFRVQPPEALDTHASERTALLTPFMKQVEDGLIRFDEALLAYDRIVGEQPSAAVDIDGRHFHYTFTPVPVATLVSAIPASIPRDLAPPDSTLLIHLAQLIEAESVSLRPRFKDEDADGTRHWRGFDLFTTWPGGGRTRHDSLSFGQKRLFAFLWYASISPELPLLTDELTNGLHAGWVRRLVELLADRQAFHAVQNPLLLDLTGPGSAEEIPGRFVLCSMTAGPERRRWAWRNPTPEEANRIRSAWDAGFQSLSEVLQSEGLW